METEPGKRNGSSARNRSNHTEPGGLIPLICYTCRRARIKISYMRLNSKPPIVPSAEDEYTPEQRRVIDAQLAEGWEDIRNGRVSAIFDTVDEMLASLKATSNEA